MGTSVQLGTGIAQCHNYRGTDVASVPSAALHAGQVLHLQRPPSSLSRQMLHLQWPASGLSGQMLHLFLATMVIGRSWSVIAVQMQLLVLSSSSQHFSHCLPSLNLLLTYVHLHVWIPCDVHSVIAQKQSFWISSMTSFSSLSNTSNLCR